MHIVSLLSTISALIGALIGGGASLAAAIYTQHCQGRLQRIAHEITKRERVYADFIMKASNLHLHAYVHDDIALNGDEQRLVGLINRMRLFAPHGVVEAAEAVLKAIIELSLKPGVELRELAKQALSNNHNPDPTVAFSVVCQADLDNVRRSIA
jgi:hypothetical protein